MGGCMSTNDPINKVITKQLKQDEKRLKTEVKLLLLGAGESGKSTILKQMKLIHAAGFNPAEIETFRSIVFLNIMQSMKLVIEAMEYLKIPLDNSDNMTPSITKGQPFPIIYFEPLKSLWADPGVRQCYERGHQYALHDNMNYFFDSLDRVFSSSYIPTDQDILRCRMKTSGIVETVFHLGPLTYRMFDVGGQRTERKKWIHCFEDVTAVLFLVAISGYDQCLVEDKDSNQMQEALMLFNSICNSPWFVNTSMILFLNKIDIFREKIKVSPVKKYFPDFLDDNQNFKQTTHFFKKKFQRLNRSEKKEIYPHFTDATDTNLLRHIMGSVTDIILTQNLRDLNIPVKDPKRIFNEEEIKNIIGVEKTILQGSAYLHSRISHWNSTIVEQTLKKLSSLNKSFKYIDKDSGIHATTTCYWDSRYDGNNNQKSASKS
ncbi:15881_t:CDS:10 [Entrophospora sp. SA101]|nr:15881_t:CDS:10 [Entrophospora sp. SA101]